MIFFETRGSCQEGIILASHEQDCPHRIITMIPSSGRAIFFIKLAADSVLSFAGDAFDQGTLYRLHLSKIRISKDGVEQQPIDVSGQCVADLTTSKKKEWHWLNCDAYDAHGERYGFRFNAKLPP
jgi:hypothetical protein